MFSVLHSNSLWRNKGTVIFSDAIISPKFITNVEICFVRSRVFSRFTRFRGNTLWHYYIIIRKYSCVIKMDKHNSLVPSRHVANRLQMDLNIAINFYDIVIYLAGRYAVRFVQLPTGSKYCVDNNVECFLLTRYHRLVFENEHIQGV